MELSVNQTTPEIHLEIAMEEINKQRFLVLLPAFIFVILFMFIGIIGNGIVIFIYGWRLRTSSIHTLLLLLACFDIVCCVVGLPLQIFEICLNFIYPSRHLCKLSVFIIFYCCNASIMTLLAICGLRYHRVCHFSKQQMTVGQAQLMAVIISLVSLPLAIPVPLLFDVVEIPLAPGLNARVCSYRGSYDRILIYFTIMLICNLITLIVMFVLYGLIWVKARKHEDMLQQHPSETSTVTQRKPRTKNRIFVGITVLFAVGFLPGLLLGVFYPLYAKVRLSNGLEALRNVVYRMWILNSTLNPVIYGFFGLRFRREVKDIFRRTLSRSKSEYSTSDAPQ